MWLRRLPLHILLFLAGMLLVVNFSQAAEIDFKKARERMVEEDLISRDIEDEKVLEAMRKVPRHLLMDEDLRDGAYDDRPLRMAEKQTITQPYIVALMTQFLNVSPGEKILEIGTGSGYQAAILAELTDNVFTIEIKKKIFEKAGSRLKKLGYYNVKLKYGDGYLGWSEHAPFDAIIITAAVNKIPPLLVKQLKIGGRLLLPLGQVLTLVTKKEKGLTSRKLTGVIFDRMTGKILE